jgi:hypothetical protein
MSRINGTPDPLLSPGPGRPPRDYGHVLDALEQILDSLPGRRERIATAALQALIAARPGATWEQLAAAALAAADALGAGLEG